MFHRGDHARRSVRLRGFDYGQPGAYFVTISVHDRECLFGDPVDGKVRVSPLGQIVEDEWLHTSALRPNVSLDVFVVMPNHFHGIVFIVEPGRSVLQYAPTDRRQALRSPAQTIGAVVRGFKAATTKRINVLRETPGEPVWQRNYYEHVVRSEAELDRIRRYIEENPLKWELDPENLLAKRRP